MKTYLKFIHFMVWMPWVHWHWRKYTEHASQPKVCFLMNEAYIRCK